jgi:hypothetical protein
MDLLYATPVGKGNNNCYAYAVDHYTNSGETKLQPGDLAGPGGVPGDGPGVDLGTCDDIVRKALDDARAMGWSLRYLGMPGDGACPSGSYKIACVIAPNTDFHWYRHHKDLLYRVKTPRTVADIAAEFGVPVRDVDAPNGKTVAAGDMVLIKNADVWSHKQGFSPAGPLLKDSCGRLIKDPWKACRDYGLELKYTVACGAFCLDKSALTNRPSGR